MRQYLKMVDVFPSEIYTDDESGSLIVDDEVELGKATCEYFEMFGLSCAVVTSFDEGILFMKNNRVKLILLDINLGKDSGFELCRALRKDTDVPILFISARQSDDDVLIALNIGGDDYIKKPFSFEELLARVRALLRRPNDFRNDILTVGHLRLNSKTFEVTRGNTPIELSRTEFRLLEFLMRRPGQIVDKEKIINHVWDFDADILPNTVEAYIGYLRRKIDSPFKKKMIKTNEIIDFLLSQIKR